MKIVIPGKPRGKGRPRFGNGRTYTDKATREYETLVATIAEQEMANIRATVTEKPVSVYIIAHFAIPKSTPKKRIAEVLSNPPKTKPDVDNIAKIVLDALNGIVFADDRQVVSCTVEKVYSESPCVEVIVKENG